MISAVLLNWQRPDNIPLIVESLRSTAKCIDDIVVWNNGPAGSVPAIADERTIVIDSDENFCTYGRMKAAQHCWHDSLYTQDDDHLVLNVDELYGSFLASQNKITAGLREGHFRVEAHKTPWLQLGWGSFHKRQWLNVVEWYIAEYGEDEVLKRKFDRIYTAIFARHDPQLAVIQRLKKPNGRYWDEDRETALYRRRDHRELTELATARALEIRAKYVERS